MPRGSSSRSGPAPDPNALRRDRDASEWVSLPATGRGAPAPEWPLHDPTRREMALWEQEWRRPQAIMWERNGQAIEVAMYVRSLKDAESPDASVASRTLVRQQMDALGLTVPGLRSNRWRIVEDGPVSAGVKPKRRRPSARDRLKVVDGGGA